MDQIKQKISSWLWICVGMVIVMVGIGGYTRLTGSGLSIVQWKPITGILPPLSAQSWHDLFAQYQLSPEFIKVNSLMSMEEFKFIYMVEFIHRLWGRLMGFVLLVPTYFVFRYHREFLPPMASIWFLASLQAFMGWFMVKSGLIDNPQVSPFRLTMHLLLAVGILMVLLHTIYALKEPVKYEKNLLFRSMFMGLAGVLLLTITFGGLTAGTHAGYIYNTFPLMNGRLWPEDIFTTTPWFLDFIYNPATIQLVHRLLAFLSLSMAAYVWYACRRESVHKNLQHLSLGVFMALCMQVLLGVSTLLLQVPVSLGVAHQVWAILSFSLTFWGLLVCLKGRVMDTVSDLKV